MMRGETGPVSGEDGPVSFTGEEKTGLLSRKRGPVLPWEGEGVSKTGLGAQQQLHATHLGKPPFFGPVTKTENQITPPLGRDFSWHDTREHKK
jgi:hypothetical protein